MIFNSKQLEELENIHDSTGAFEEEGDDEAGFDEVGEAAMDWRRGLIEEATENIKRAKTRPVEPHIQYDIGSMLFDREEKRFARVHRSVPGYLKIVYLAGGEREYGNLDLTGYLREVGAEKRVGELSLQLGMSDGDVILELERLGITPLEELETPETAPEAQAEAQAAATPTVRARKPNAQPVPAVVEFAAVAHDDVRAQGPAAAIPGKSQPRAAVAGQHAAKQAEKPAAKQHAEKPAAKQHAEKPAAKHAEKPAAKHAEKPAAKQAEKPAAKHAEKPAAKQSEKQAAQQSARPAAKQPEKPGRSASPAAAAARQPANGKAAVTAPTKQAKTPVETAKKPASPPPAQAATKSANPIDDPNGYIRAHFQDNSNRELARLTGLSEHTIRRKLGEWGLKRKKEA